MREALQFYIDGNWVDPVVPKTLDVVNPATEEVCGRISLGSAADVDLAVAAAKRAFISYSQTTREQRIDLLQSILDEFAKRHDEVAEAIMEEMGAPWELARDSQTASGPQHIKAALRALKNYEFEETTRNTRIVKEPIGVCGLITPWNWPMNQIAVKVAPALAAGCTMVLKPSEIAPFDAIIFAEILDAAGVPAGVFNLVNGDGPGVGTALSQHPDIDMMSFTGSTRAGVLVAQNSAPTVKRVAQELGGKSANIILDDADFEAAVKGGAGDCFENTGQSCDAPTRMLVPKDKIDEAAAIAAAVAEATVVGDPRDENTEVGPLVSELQWNKVQGLIQQGIDEGATLAAGGTGRPDGLDKGYYAKPTVFANVSNDMTIAREEIFGPVLSIIPYEDDDDAVRIANDTPYGLSGYVSSSNLDRARNIAARLRTGMVHINGAYADSSAPFGGYKQSGNGREWGPHGMEEFLEVKSIYGYESRTLAGCLSALALSACSGESSLPEATGKGSIRAINAIETSPAIAFLIEERTIGSVAFKESSTSASYDDLSYNFNFEVLFIGDTARTRIATQPLDVVANKDYTFIISGAVSAPAITIWEGDQREWGEAETVTEFRFGHTAASEDPVDVYLAAPDVAPADGAEIGTLAFGEVLPAIEMPAGEYVVTITSAGDEADILFSSTSFVTLAATSLLFNLFDGDANDVSELALHSFNTTSGGTAVFTDSRLMPTLRFFHASKELGLVDIFIEDLLAMPPPVPLVSSHAFKDVTDDISVATGTLPLAYTTANEILMIHLQEDLNLSAAFRWNMFLFGPISSTEASIFLQRTCFQPLSESRLAVFL